MPAPYTLDDYLNLVISQHADKPKFMAVLAGIVAPLVQLQSALFILQTLFDLDTATGVQLDRIGEWLNRPRRVKTPINGVYFSVDDPSLGVDQGIIFTPYSPVTGLIDLDDDHYRLALRAKIAADTWDGTLPGAAWALQTLIQEPIADPDKSFVLYQANTSHEALIAFAGKLPTALAQSLLQQGYISLAAPGVDLRYAVTSVDGSPIFGLDMDNKYVSGVDVGAIATIL